MSVQLLSFQVFKHSIDQNVEKFGFDFFHIVSGMFWIIMHKVLNVFALKM